MAEAEEWVEAWVENTLPTMIWAILTFTLVCITLPLLFCFERYCFRDAFKVAPEEPKEATPEPEEPPQQDVPIQTEPTKKKCRKKCRPKIKTDGISQTTRCRGYGLGGGGPSCATTLGTCQSQSQSVLCSTAPSTLAASRSKCCKSAMGLSTTTTLGGKSRCQKSAAASMTISYTSTKCTKSKANVQTASKFEMIPQMDHITQTDYPPQPEEPLDCGCLQGEECTCATTCDDEDGGVSSQTDRVRRKVCTCPCQGRESLAHLCTCDKIKTATECQTAPPCLCPCQGRESLAHLCTCAQVRDGVSCQTLGTRRKSRCTCPCEGRESRAHLCTCGKVKMESECQTGEPGCVCPCQGDETKAHLCTCGYQRGSQGSAFDRQRPPGAIQIQSQDKGQGQRKDSKDGENKINKFLQWDWEDPCVCPDEFVGKRLRGLSWTEVINYAQADGGAWVGDKKEDEKREEEMSEQFSEPDTDVE